LLEELRASDQSGCSDDDDSSGTNYLTVVEVIGSECSDSESDDEKCATASICEMKRIYLRPSFALI